MKTISLTDFRDFIAKSKVPEIKESPCLKVTADQEPIIYIVVNPEGEMRNRIEGLCGLIDNSRGR